ncbi:MAG: hypothetical protein Q9181_001226 [Wetmoreana brouardii]
MFPYEYPFILGRDIAGEVFEVGKFVIAVKKGNRVLGYGIGSVSHRREEDASSFGSNVIQLVASSGCSVITTASFKNFDYVKRLGASQVFDYNKSSVVSDIVTALESKAVAGVFDAIGAYGAFDACLKVVTHLIFSGVKFISTVRPPPERLPSGVSAKIVLVGEIKDSDVSQAIFQGYLPRALAEGKLVAAPDPHVVGGS